MFHSSQHIMFHSSQQTAYKSLDEASDMDTAFTDFGKIFDRVDHCILLMKLFKNGVGRKLIKILKNYLSNRSQSVKVNSEISDPKLVTSGVPQGSILGPLFFLFF